MWAARADTVTVAEPLTEAQAEPCMALEAAAATEETEAGMAEAERAPLRVATTTQVAEEPVITEAAAAAVTEALVEEAPHTLAE